MDLSQGGEIVAAGAALWRCLVPRPCCAAHDP